MHEERRRCDGCASAPREKSARRAARQVGLLDPVDRTEQRDA